MSLRVFRISLLAATLLPVAGSAQRPAADAAAQGIIRGTVTAADTGRPLRGASVRVQGADVTPLEARSAVTDERGRYEVTGLKAGRYTLSVSKSGYLTLSHGQLRPREAGRPLTVSESTPLDKVDLSLPRASVIVARITDQFGDPVRGVVVRAYLPRFMNGRRQLSQAGGNASLTDDRGETRIFGLQPGDYYVVATPEFMTTWRGEVETLHPGTLNVSDARTVSVGVGEEAFATFPILRARPSSLSGVIVGSHGGPLTTPQASLAHPMLSGGSSRRLNVAADGTFHEENLAPGEWVISVREPEYGSARVQLLGDDIQGLVVTTRKGATVRGRLTFDGGSPPDGPLQIGVTFDGEPPLMGLSAGSLRSASGVSSITAAPDNGWAFEAQISGTGVIRARPSNWLLKAVLLDGTDVTDTMLDFGSAYEGKPVEVVLTQRRAEVNGVVLNDRGQPQRDSVVVLFPEDEKQWTPYSRFIAIGRPDQEARFTIGGLPAGRYLAAALEYLEPGEERNPETLSRLRGAATAVELPEGESRSLSVRLTR